MRIHQRQFNEARLPRRVINPLSGLLIIARLRPEDILDERLRIAIVKWEPARLHLNHDSMAGQKDVIGRRQTPAI